MTLRTARRVGVRIIHLEFRVKASCRLVASAPPLRFGDPNPASTPRILHHFPHSLAREEGLVNGDRKEPTETSDPNSPGRHF